MTATGSSEGRVTAAVLVADDDADYRLLARLALDGAAGLGPVLEAADADEMARLVDEHRPQVVLADVSLPGVFDALARVTDGVAGGAPRVVLVSSRPPDELAAAAAAIGAVGYLGKDVAPSELPAALADALEVVDRAASVLAKASGRLASDSRSAGKARRMVRRTLEGWCDEQRLDDIELCVSEVVTNAVVHATGDPGVLVQVRAGHIHVEISDDSDAMPVARGAGPEDASGRGMSILGELADRWGTRRRSGGGKTVWFDVVRGSGAATAGER